MTVFASSGPSGWVESLIAGSTLLVAILLGISGIIFRYRPAAIAGGLVAFLVVFFWIFCAVRYNTPGAPRAATIALLIGIALLFLERSPKK